MPAAYDRTTGKRLYYRLAENNKTGGWDVAASEKFFFNAGNTYELSSGDTLSSVRGVSVFDDQRLFTLGRIATKLHVFDLAGARITEEERKDRRGNPVIHRTFEIDEIGALKMDVGDVLIKAGPRIYVGAEDRILAIDPPSDDGDGAIAWEAKIKGTPARLVAAADRLLVTTDEGAIYCFGPDATLPRQHQHNPVLPERDEPMGQMAEAILAVTPDHGGYCVAWGIGSGRLVSELVASSELRVIAVDPDAARVAAFRDEMIAADWYGERVEAVVGDAITAALPPYLATLMVAEDPASLDALLSPAALASVFESLRPYGGMASFKASEDQYRRLAALVEAADLPGARLRREGELAIIERSGPLPGSANWTHEHADASNTRVSRDERVKVPLGMLWFGGPSHRDVLPRHGHGPQPQVIDGRLIIEGADMLRAVDIYTGRKLWQRDFPGIGYLYNNVAHQPGANGIGTNYVSTSDGIYVAYGERGLRLDPQTGDTMAEFTLPAADDPDEPATWGYINVIDDYLIAG
ncbi:MAG: hypothetical protein QXE79_06035, partial [Candidatus Bathyarchaeia archaeon]